MSNTRWVSMDFHADIITVPVAVKVKAQYTLKPNFIFSDVLWLGGFQLVNRVWVRGEEDLIVWRQHYIYVMHNNSFVSIEFSCSRQLSWPISFFCAHAIKFFSFKTILPGYLEETINLMLPHFYLFVIVSMPLPFISFWMSALCLEADNYTHDQHYYTLRHLSMEP